MCGFTADVRFIESRYMSTFQHFFWKVIGWWKFDGLVATGYDKITHFESFFFFLSALNMILTHDSMKEKQSALRMYIDTTLNALWEKHMKKKMSICFY